MTWYELAHKILEMPEDELKKPAVTMTSGVGYQLELSNVILHKCPHNEVECKILDSKEYYDNLPVRILKKGEYYLC